MKEAASALWSIVWHVGGLLCHQLPDRSPQFMGVVFPLCYRCTGLYVSFLVAFVCILANGGWRRRLPDLRWALPMSIGMLPFFVDGWANVLGLWASAGWVRALTGMSVGLVLPPLLVPLLQRADADARDAMKPTVSTPLALLSPVTASLALLWLAAHPVRLWVFQSLAVAVSFAPTLFVVMFVVAVWRHNARSCSGLHIAAGDVPC